MKNQIRVESPFSTPTARAGTHTHTQEEAISEINFILKQRPKQLLFLDSMHLCGPWT